MLWLTYSFRINHDSFCCILFCSKFVNLGDISHLSHLSTEILFGNALNDVTESCQYSLKQKNADLRIHWFEREYFARLIQRCILNPVKHLS